MPIRRKPKRMAELLDQLSEPFSRITSNLQPQVVHVERVPMVVRDSQEDASQSVPWSLRVIGAWSWRILVGCLVVAVFGVGVYYLSSLVIPMLLALLFSVLLDPVNRFLQRQLRFPATLSAMVSLLIGLGVVVGLVSVASSQILSQFEHLAGKAQLGLQTLVTWLTDGPLRLDSEAIDSYTEKLTDEITGFAQQNGSEIASGALSVTSSVANLLTGFLLAMFILFFFLKEGRRIWLWFVRILPAAARVPVHESAIRGWITLGAYARTQIIVAAIDATGIGLGAYILGVPLAIPLGVLVFVGSFIPIVGAVVTGSIAVLVALVDQGPQTAVIMLLVILAVQQIEGNLLHPWLMSNAVSLHPVAVLLAVAAGSYLFGIIGALFAVPVTAFVNTSMLYLHGYDKFPQLATDSNRPGGPPGTLEAALLATYDPAMKRTDPDQEPQVVSSEDVRDSIESLSNDPEAVEEKLGEDPLLPPEASGGAAAETSSERLAGEPSDDRDGDEKHR